LHLTNAAASLITKLIRVHEHVRPVENRRNLIGAVGVSPWEDLRRLTSGHVHRRPIASNLVPSPEHLHETVGVLLVLPATSTLTSSWHR
jgi:hypothetical protein